MRMVYNLPTRITGLSLRKERRHSTNQQGLIVVRTGVKHTFSCYNSM